MGEYKLLIKPSAGREIDAIDPRDHTVIYAESQNGRLYFVDLETREEKGIRPIHPSSPTGKYLIRWRVS